MLIAWTTVTSSDDAEKLADSTIKAGLAICMQIEGPST